MQAFDKWLKESEYETNRKLLMSITPFFHETPHKSYFSCFTWLCIIALCLMSTAYSDNTSFYSFYSIFILSLVREEKFLSAIFTVFYDSYVSVGKGVRNKSYSITGQPVNY